MEKGESVSVEFGVAVFRSVTKRRRLGGRLRRGGREGN